MTWTLIIYLSMAGMQVATVEISNFDSKAACELTAANANTTPSKAIDFHIDSIRYACRPQGLMK